MTNNPELIQKLSMATTSSFVYAFSFFLLVHTYNGGKEKNDRTRAILPLLMLAGIPPFPTFFFKLWAVGYLLGSSNNVALVLLVVINTALLIAYLDFIARGKKQNNLKLNTTPKKIKDFSLHVITASTLFIALPELFMLL